MLWRKVFPHKNSQPIQLFESWILQEQNHSWGSFRVTIAEGLFQVNTVKEMLQNEKSFV